jgi:hypothetical protein
VDKVFIDNNGFFYKAVATTGKKGEVIPGQAKDPSHAERPCITQEFLQALPDDGTPMLIVDIEAKVQTILSQRAEKRDEAE